MMDIAKIITDLEDHAALCDICSNGGNCKMWRDIAEQLPDKPDWQ